AEVIKYAANAFLALKISFINEIADFCELIGADVKEVARGIGYDKRIGSQFLEAGIGYGGSCFGKDTKALVARGEEQGYEFKIIKALSTVNDSRYALVLKKLKKYYPNVSGLHVAILGLAFKPMTNDVRDTPAERIIFELLESGATVSVFDPVAMPGFKKHFKRSAELTFGPTLYDALAGADACIIITKWNEFKNCDLAKARICMKGDVLIDGRNMFERAHAQKSGFRYEGVGR
ncbi:MAG: nucleotide sugar dehydrogenase, partial [Patescibacteria group bacterium]